ncbi:MAG: hypothetical protein IKV50_09155 [Clostridia bacterium]|nr:hypothetical protein [Clostridia bacterium]MBR5264844.1 hypothetical protein [Clostridia bacterium]
MSIEEAIELIKEKYAKNKNAEYVRNPVAYTLYQVWRISDAQSEKKPIAVKKTNEPYDLLYEEGGANTTW